MTRQRNRDGSSRLLTPDSEPITWDLNGLLKQSVILTAVCSNSKFQERLDANVGIDVYSFQTHH